jgi:hypothetical protein
MLRKRDNVHAPKCRRMVPEVTHAQSTVKLDSLRQFTTGSQPRANISTVIMSWPIHYFQLAFVKTTVNVKFLFST